MADEKLLPEALKDLWQNSDKRNFTSEECDSEQEKLLDGYRQVWTRALLLEGCNSLLESLFSELGEYLGWKPTEAEQLCEFSAKRVEEEWHEMVGTSSSAALIERFYDQSRAYLCDLTLWHTLREDQAPLAYVTALRFAQRQHCTRHLDFGAGISSGSILFRAHGFQVTSADISSSLQRYSQWRFAKRRMQGQFIDLKTSEIPRESFDFITAMDVFEHLSDAIGEAGRLADALVPGGFLYGRFALDPHDERPQHILRDFQPVRARFRDAGLVKVWEDDWLWGHEVFQRL